MQLSDVPETYQGNQVEERRRRMNDKRKIAGLDASIVPEAEGEERCDSHGRSNKQGRSDT